MDVTKRIPRRNMPPIPPLVAERAATRYVPDDSGCWLSTYSRASHGYAQIGWQGSEKNHGTTAHRAAWTHHHGPVPDGATVDHTCHVRPCVNPDHLRLLDNEANAEDNGRVAAPTTVVSDRLHSCGARMYLYPSGAYRCPDCTNARSRERQRRLKAERRARKATP